VEYWLGIDAGSTTLKGVALDAAGTVLRQCSLPASADYRGGLAQLRAELTTGEAPVALAATGYGQALLDDAQLSLSEIGCHARGIHQLCPPAEVLIDIGGQDVKAVRITPGGKAADFAMNDKCAAGTGRFLDVMARALGVGLPELSALAGRAPRPAPISSMCAVFAETEVITLLAQGRSREEVAAGLLESIGERIAALARRMGPAQHYALSGGGALQPGLVRTIAARLRTEPYIPPWPQLVGALGAALAVRARSLA
jgi:(R)-2-hydroxyacyl-CoA dehydratese activating ATPase